MSGAKILAIWEYGGGMGHVMRLGPVCATLASDGFKVRAYLPSTSDQIQSLFTPAEIRVMDARVKGASERGEAVTFTDVLWNQGWNREDKVLAMATAWRRVFDEERPDAVLLDFAPAALLAAQTIDTMVFLVDNTFAVPPDVSPLPDLSKPDPSAPSETSCRRENDVLAACRVALDKLGPDRTLERFASMYYQPETRVLLGTFPELDHYPQRQNAEHWGPWWKAVGISPGFPKTPGPRIFAYLKTFPNLPFLLQAMNDARASLLACIPGLPQDTISQLNNVPGFHVTTEPINLLEAGREADFAALHAGGSAGSMLALGVPVLSVPLTLEQTVTAYRVSQLGAGVIADPRDQHGFGPALQTMLGTPSIRAAAQRFREAHPEFDPLTTIRRVADRIAQDVRN